MNKNTLKQAQLDTLNEEIETSTARLEEVIKEQTELRNHSEDIRAKIKSNERENEELRKETGEVQHKLNMLERERFDLSRLINQNKNSISEDENTKKVIEEFNQQTGFYDLLTRRIKLLQDNLADGFSNFNNFLEPATAVVLIKTKIEGVGFDRHLVNLRGLKANYESTIWSFCERKVKGEVIAPQETKAVLDGIDNALLAPEISVYWNKQ